HQPVPERAYLRVRVTPVFDDGLHFFIAADVLIVGDVAPCSNPTTEAACQFGALSELTLGRGDGGDRGGMPQHAVGDDAVDIEVFVAGLVEASEVVELPYFAGDPSDDPAFDGTEVDADQFIFRSRA